MEDDHVDGLVQSYQEMRDPNVPDNLINLEGEISSWPEFLNHFQYLTLRLQVASVERQDIQNEQQRGIRKALELLVEVVAMKEKPNFTKFLEGPSKEEEMRKEPSFIVPNDTETTTGEFGADTNIPDPPNT